MASHTVKLWNKSSPRAQSSDDFACGQRMKRDIAVNLLPIRAPYCSLNCLHELGIAQSLPVAPRHEEMPEVLR